MLNKIKAYAVAAVPTVIVVGLFFLAYNKSEKLRKALGAAA